MPGGDETGPWGRGPMTGKGLGRCGGYYQFGFGAPRGRGFGRGRGWYTGFFPDRMPTGPVDTGPYYREPTVEEEKAYLEGLVKDIEAELEGIKERLGEIESEMKG